MQTALRQMVTVQKGRHIQICSSELPEGARAEVIILLESAQLDVSDAWSEEDLLDFTCSGEDLILMRLMEKENA